MKPKLVIIILCLAFPMLLNAQGNNELKNYLKTERSISVTFNNETLTFKLKFVDKKGYFIEDEAGSIEVADEVPANYKEFEERLKEFLKKEFPTEDKKQLVLKELIILELKHLVKKHEKEKEKRKDEDKIAIVWLKSKEVDVYKKTSAKLRKVEDVCKDENCIKNAFYVDSIIFNYYESFIKSIQVIGKLNGNSCRFNSVGMIPARYKKDIERINGDTYLLKSKINDLTTYYIKLSDILDYHAIYKPSLHAFCPLNESFVLKKIEEPVDVYQRPYIKNFDMRLYSDVLGIVNGSKPNGVLQIEGQANFILLTVNVFRNRPVQLNGIFLHKIGLFVKYAKLDNGNKTLALKNSFEVDEYDGEETARVATNIDLLSHSNLNIGFELDVFSLISQNTKTDIKINAGVFSTKIDSVYNDINVDTTFRAPTKNNIFSYYLNPEASFAFHNDRYLSFSLKLGVVYSGLFKNPDGVRQLGKRSKDLLDDVPGGDFVSKILEDPTWKFQANLAYHPNKDGEKTVYGRFTGLINNGVFHPALELGYSAPISDFLPKADKDK